MSRKIQIKIDGKPVEVEEGSYLLAAIESLGIEIPAPCRYPFLPPRPVCKVCSVEVALKGTGPKIVESCSFECVEGMEVSTESEPAREARKKALRNMVARCAENDLLKDIAVQMDVASEIKFGKELCTCIYCKLCIRVCDELVGAGALSFKKGKVKEEEGESTPIVLDPEKCIMCGACAHVCPTDHLRLEEEHDRSMVHKDMELGPNSAISLSFRQAVPNVPRIHAEDCIHFKLGGCKVCSEVCPKDCIHYDEKDIIEEIEVGTIITATGFQDFDPTPMKQYGYGKLPNVISALEFEKMNNAASPTNGKIVMEDGTEPRSIAILHCIGSRDEHYHTYCSRVCCMYAAKFAHLVKEKTTAEVYQCYIDMRCFGKGYEEFYKRILDEGVNVIRGKAAEVIPARYGRNEEGKLLVCLEDTLIGKFREVPVDMVVLCTALESHDKASEFGRKLNISTGADGWFIEAHPKLGPVSTTTDGVFLAGVCQSPKDIPDTVAQSGAAAAQAMKLMNVGEVQMDGAYAEIHQEFCSGCKICNGLCPYNAITFEEDKKVSYVNPALCKACGTCVAACPSGAIEARHFTDDQIYAQIEGILS